MAKYEAIYDTDVGSKGKLKQSDREKSLQRLMVTNLLKRLESSVHAFRLTLEKLKQNHCNALEGIRAFQESGQDTGLQDAVSAFEDAEFDDDDMLDMEGVFSTSPFSTGGKVKINLEDMDLTRWQHDLDIDLTVIDELLVEMNKVSPQEDAKLQHVKGHVEAKLKAPINPGNRKVLIFTAFADTADYLYDQLAQEFKRSQGVEVAKVTGSSTPKTTIGTGYDYQTLLTLFSPRSKERAAILPDVEIELDILIGTDCISEGQNLQDCDYLIN